jgi:hypothetical protein
MSDYFIFALIVMKAAHTNVARRFKFLSISLIFETFLFPESVVLISADCTTNLFIASHFPDDSSSMFDCVQYIVKSIETGCVLERTQFDPMIALRSLEVAWNIDEANCGLWGEMDQSGRAAAFAREHFSTINSSTHQPVLGSPDLFLTRDDE